MTTALWTIALVRLMLAAVAPAATFTPWFTDRGVQVETSRHGSETPWIRGTFDVSVTPDKVVAALSDFKRYKEIFAPALESVTVLASSPDNARLHLVWPYPSPFRDRDAVVVYRMERLANGAGLLTWRSEAKPTDPKRGVRIERVQGETRIEPLNGGAHVVYTYFGDLGGNFPASINERVWKGEPVGYMQAVRRAVGLPILKK